MANWKKVIVSGSIAELNQVSASTGIYIPTSSLNDGTNDNFILTIASEGNVEKRDPKLIGASFQSMSIAGITGLGEFGTNTFIAQPGLNELVFVSGSNVILQTSQSLNDTSSETVGFVKITAITSSVAATAHQTTVSAAGSVYTIGTAQDISTGSNVAFANISASGDVSASNIFLATDIIHQDDSDTKIGFGTNEVNVTTGGTRRVHIDSNGIEVTGNITASGHISASALDLTGNASVGGDLGIGGVLFGLQGFGVTIDDTAITSGSVNFGSGSMPSDNIHKFTGSVSITGSGITLQDGTFSGDGNSLTNLSADNLVDIHDLTWGYGLTSSNGSAYNVTSSIKLEVHISGSEITSSVDGLFIPSSTIRLDHLTASANQGDIISFSGSAKTPYYISTGTDGQVLTSNGTNATASFQDLPPTLALGIETGSLTSKDIAKGVGLLLTSSLDGAVVTEIPISGSDNQISISGSQNNNTIFIQLADNIKNINRITASVGIETGFLRTTGNISASGNVTIGGDLEVRGDTTILHTSNLLVEDAFVTLASGSSQTDGGIIVQTGASGGKGFGWDNTTGRWGLQDGLLFNATNLLPTEFMVSAFLSSSNPSVNTSPTYGQAATKKQSSGQLWINTGSGDIWIYVD